MNECNKYFLRKNGIDVNTITRELDCHIYNFQQINPILYDNEFQEHEEECEICIGDVLGKHASSTSQNIFQILDDFFDRNGDGYHTRALGMLEMTPENVMEQLKSSFKREPMVFARIENGKYVIFINGMHRFAVLRVLYLKEIQEAKGNKDSIEQIRKKYTISAKSININSKKGYCKYLIEKTNPAWINPGKVIEEKPAVDENGNIIENRYQIVYRVNRTKKLCIKYYRC